MGRPSKLTDEVQQRIIDGIRLGVHLDVAAAYGGIHYATFRQWMTKGEGQSQGRYREFYEAVTQAERQLEMELVGRVVLASKTDWRAAVELLKRRHTERWGNSTKLTGFDGGPVQIQTTREQALEDGKERARHLRAV